MKTRIAENLFNVSSRVVKETINGIGSVMASTNETGQSQKYGL